MMCLQVTNNLYEHLTFAHANFKSLITYLLTWKDVLNNFKDNKGQFILRGDEQHMMTSMINLLRASSISFLGEAVMEDAKVFSSAYIRQLLEKSQDIKHNSFLREVMTFWIVCEATKLEFTQTLY